MTDLKVEEKKKLLIKRLNEYQLKFYNDYNVKPAGLKFHYMPDHYNRETHIINISTVSLKRFSIDELYFILGHEFGHSIIKNSETKVHVFLYMLSSFLRFYFFMLMPMVGGLLTKLRSWKKMFAYIFGMFTFLQIFPFLMEFIFCMIFSKQRKDLHEKEYMCDLISFYLNDQDGDSVNSVISKLHEDFFLSKYFRNWDSYIFTHPSAKNRKLAVNQEKFKKILKSELKTANMEKLIPEDNE